MSFVLAWALGKIRQDPYSPRRIISSTRKPPCARYLQVAALDLLTIEHTPRDSGRFGLAARRIRYAGVLGFASRHAGGSN